MGKILLNVMYAGDYLKEENNVGHEVINMYKSDNGNHYIYANPYGLIGTKHYKKDAEVDTIVLVRRISSKKLEVLAKAKIEELLLKPQKYNFEPEIFKSEKELTEKFKANPKCKKTYEEQLTAKIERLDKKKKIQKEIHDEQISRIKADNITYGGVHIDSILKNNKNNELATYVTFKVKDFKKLNKSIYLSTEEGDDKTTFKLDTVFAKESLKMYYLYDEESDKEEYKTGNKIMQILNDSCWSMATDAETVALNDVENEEKINFLQIIKKENDELVFSNLFAYFFAKYDNNILKAFAKEILDIELKGKIRIAREENNIDLLIRDDEHIVIIENKIKSGINGIKKRRKWRYNNSIK